MRIALIFDRTRDDTSGNYFARALTRLGVSVEHFWLREAARIPASGFDVYLRIDHGDYVDDLPAQLRPSAFYLIDTHLPGPLRKMRRGAPRYDVVFCAQREALRWFPRAVWVPAACDPELHGGESPQTRRFDVGFVGTEGGLPRKLYLLRLPLCEGAFTPESRLTLHLFSRRGVTGLLRTAGFRLCEVRLLGHARNGLLPQAWLGGSWRALGFLIAAERP